MKTTSVFLGLAAWVVAAVSAAGGTGAAPWKLAYADGRVMVRTGSSPRIEFPVIGREVKPGEVLITGDRTRFELRDAKDGLWRVGRRAVFMSANDGWRLMAGTALVRVPEKDGWNVASERGAVRLGQGMWILQAVDNEGLKIVCLNGPSWVTAINETASSEPTKLRPGELVFLKPGGLEFGPIVTIYLEELLATSRLVNGYPKPLEEMRRLMNLGLIQREKLKGVTGALVAGARDDDGFEIAVPKPREEPPKK